MRQKIITAIKQRINKLQQEGAWSEIDIPEINLERPKEYAHGDYTLNLGFILASILHKSPTEITNDVVSDLRIEGIEKIEAVGGYINITKDRVQNISSLKSIVTKGDAYGTNQCYANKTVIVEHSSLNLFKPFHVGHLVNTIVGESIVRLFEVSGARVVKISYPSDVSLGIAKAVWAANQKGANVLLNQESSVYEKMQFMGECYAHGTVQYDEDETAQKEIRKINKDLYSINQREQKSVTDNIYLSGKKLSIAYIEQMLQRLGSHIDGYIYESQSAVVGKKIVQKNIGDIFEESNDAVIYKGEQDNLHTRVFLNKEDMPTYEAKDIGLLSLKFNEYNPDVSVVVTDAEQKNYYEVVLAAAGKIESSWKEKTKHIVHGRLQFSGMKVSSRLGNVPLAEDILEAIQDSIKVKIQESAITKKQHENSESLVDSIAVGAIKFAILKTSLGKNIVFDPRKALSFEGDSGPYLQYTYARAASVLRAAKEASISSEVGDHCDEGLILERILDQYPEVVLVSTKENTPHNIASYLLKLAHSYNKYYAANKIVDPNDPLSPYRVLLTSAIQVTIKNGLHTLGMKAPKSM